MPNVEKYAEELLEMGRLAKEFKNSMNSVCDGSFEWGVEEVVKSFTSLFDRFCPYEVDDRVELSRNIDMGSTSGWAHCKHFLIRGSKGTVRERGYREGKFVFDIVFDDETWIDDNGDSQPVTYKHTFNINESYLQKSN